MTSSDWLLCLCTYNELGNLPTLLEAIWRHAPQLDVLVVDDASPDGTGAWCDEKAAREPRLTVIHRAGKLGLGTATMVGMRAAVARGYRWLITMDADFSHPPNLLPKMMQTALRGPDPVDVVVASRYVPGGGVSGWPWTRRWMSRAVNWWAQNALRLPVRDASGAFRCYRVERLRPLLDQPLHATGYAYVEEVLWRLRRQGARMVEIPFMFHDRAVGRSKLDLGEAFRALRLLAWLGGVERGWLIDCASTELETTTGGGRGGGGGAVR